MRKIRREALGAMLFSILATKSPAAIKTSSEAGSCQPAGSGNPIIDGWYADPDMKIYDGVYWLYPTYSAPYEEQTFLDAFSSPDLINWTKHSHVLDKSSVTWAQRAIWAPSPISRKGKYYLYFGANDIQNDSQVGGIGVAVADKPEGPYKDAIGRPLIERFVNGAQPIDQNVFIDDDGQAYIYYGGWGHCNVARLNDDMISLSVLPDGSTFREITPSGYVEGALMFKRKGVYYLMWSEGGWTGPDYSVSYAMADSPLGPFNKLGTILKQNAAIARGSGHNTVVNVPGSDTWYIFYHRRPLGETDGNHRVVSYDVLSFKPDGTINPVEMTSRDNFCDGNNLGWKTYGGTWQVKEGQYTVASDAAAYSLLDNNFSAVDFEADLTIGKKGHAGLLFRVANARNSESYRGYFAGLDPQNNRLFLGKTDGATWTELGAVSQTLDPEVSYHLRVVAVGSEIKVYLNHSADPQLTLSDSSYATGATGVRTFEAAAQFDNINVTAPKAVFFYLDGDFSGPAVSLLPGTYRAEDLAKLGIPNDTMSSLQVPTGWTVEVYQDDNFAGAHWTFRESARLLPELANDQMSSVKIIAP